MDGDAVAYSEAGVPIRIDDRSCWLVAQWHWQWLLEGAQATMPEVVQVGAADTRSLDLDQHLIGLWLRDIFERNFNAANLC